MDAFGECHNEACDSVLPWDMPAIAVNDTNAFCGPECAVDFLESTNERVETVTLHDPQYHADRPEGVDESSVSIWREVSGVSEALITVDELERMHNGEFRV